MLAMTTPFAERQQERRRELREELAIKGLRRFATERGLTMDQARRVRREERRQERERADQERQRRDEWAAISKHNAWLRETLRLRIPTAHPPKRPFKKIVYLLLGQDGEVLYVGKGDWGRPEQHFIGSFAEDIYKIRRRPVMSNGDAMVLEALFIRKYQPRHNHDGVDR